MARTPGPTTVSTKLQRIAELAKAAPDMALTTLAHHIDIEFLHEAYRRTRKDGATGVDGQTAQEYAENLEANLRSLLERAKAGTYRAPPVRRVYIPKGGDKSKTRPIGIPTFEDKILQRAVAMVLEAIYEQEFLNFSYGFRPERSAHQAVDATWKALMDMHGGWVVEVDIQGFFDAMDKSHLVTFLRQRVRDGVLLRLIGKWLNAGVLEDGNVMRPKSGSPQGGVISPILSNVYLHEVFDRWFESVVKDRLVGRSFAVRFADDILIILSNEDDARRVMSVLPKRFGRFGLTLHPEKTRMIEFHQPPWGSKKGNHKPGQTRSFDLLGFTHFWGLSRKGRWVVKCTTAKDRLKRSAKRIWEWCRDHRHQPIKWQHEALSRKINGHYAYFGITGNSAALWAFRELVGRAWKKWLARRSHRAKGTWDWFNRLLRSYPLPQPRIVHHR